MMADKNLKVRGDGDGWPQKGAKDAKWELLAVGGFWEFLVVGCQLFGRI
jgi:hypothetical protein